MSGGLGESRRLGELPLVDDARLFEILYPGLRRFAAAVAPPRWIRTICCKRRSRGLSRRDG